jgi:hypothetical protein
MWSGDFWGEGTWQRIVPRQRPSPDGKVAKQQSIAIQAHGDF